MSLSKLKTKCCDGKVRGVRKAHGEGLAPPDNSFSSRHFLCAVTLAARKGQTMVTHAVDYLGQVRPTCFARTILFEASESYDRGDYVTAGIKLREATRRYLHALCEHYDAWPKQRTLRKLLQALRSAGHVDQGMYKWFCEIIDLGDRCARCQPVKPGLIEFGIVVIHKSLDYSNGVELVEPNREGGAV